MGVFRSSWGCEVPSMSSARWRRKGGLIRRPGCLIFKLLARIFNQFSSAISRVARIFPEDSQPLKAPPPQGVWGRQPPEGNEDYNFKTNHNVRIWIHFSKLSTFYFPEKSIDFYIKIFWNILKISYHNCNYRKQLLLLDSHIEFSHSGAVLPRLFSTWNAISFLPEGKEQISKNFENIRIGKIWNL